MVFLKKVAESTSEASGSSPALVIAHPPRKNAPCSPLVGLSRGVCAANDCESEREQREPGTRKKPTVSSFS